MFGAIIICYFIGFGLQEVLGDLLVLEKQWSPFVRKDMGFWNIKNAIEEAKEAGKTIKANRQKMIWNIFKRKKTNKQVLKKPAEETEALQKMGVVKFNHRVRKDSENMTDKEKMDKGFNGKTYSVNGIEYD